MVVPTGDDPLTDSKEKRHVEVDDCNNRIAAMLAIALTGNTFIRRG